MVVLAFGWIVADPIVTGAAGAAVAVAAALGADVGGLPKAAEEPVAAVVLFRTGAACAGDFEDTAGFTGALAAFVLGNAFGAAAARVSGETRDLEAVMAFADGAFPTVGVDAAFAKVAMAILAVAKVTFALVVATTEFAMRAFRALATTEVVRGTAGLSDALVFDTGGDGAGGGRRFDAILTGAALSFHDPDAVATDAAAPADTGTAKARLACLTVAVIAAFGAIVGAIALATVLICLAIVGGATRAGIDAVPPTARLAGATDRIEHTGAVFAAIDRAVVRWLGAIFAGATFLRLADAIRVAHLAAGALIVVAALRAIVFWSAGIAAALICAAIWGRGANTIIADGRAAEVGETRIAIRG